MGLFSVCYSAQKNAWMDSTWFHEVSLLFVSENLAGLGLEKRTIQLCSPPR